MIAEDCEEGTEEELLCAVSVIAEGSVEEEEDNVMVESPTSIGEVLSRGVGIVLRVIISTRRLEMSEVRGGESEGG
jgi:beta-lactam-binding protein with PASTA domain